MDRSSCSIGTFDGPGAVKGPGIDLTVRDAKSCNTTNACIFCSWITAKLGNKHGMIIGFLFLGSLIGLFAAIAAILAGSSLSTALFVYVLTGAAGTGSIALFPLFLSQLAVGIEEHRRSATSDEQPLANGEN